MKQLLLFCLLLLAVPVMAQNGNCEYVKNEYDQFLKIQKVETSETLVYNWYKRLSFSFANYGGNKYLIAQVSLLDPALFTSGDKMIILFDDGTTLELELLSDSGKLASFGETFTAAGISAQNYKLFYPIKSTDDFKNKKLSGVRLYNSGNFVEFPVGKTGKELGLAGKAKKLERLNAIFAEARLQCINI